jgi:ankyrin repeat protein
MIMRRSASSAYPVIISLFLIISTGMMSCHGKGNRKDETARTAKVPDQQAPAAIPAAPGQHSTVDQQVMNDAALNGELTKVKELIRQGADPDQIDPDGRTALMYASFNGHTEIVRLLLDEGAEVGTRDALGRTALLYASTGPFAETVKLLLDNHADPNITDNDEHFSPLMHAAAEGQLEVVKLLLDSGADPSLKDIDGETAALFALNNGHTEVAGLIQSALDSR